MGLLKCLSPRASNSKEGTLRCELQQVKAQLAEAKITIADLKQGAAIDGRISTSITPSTCSVAVQAKPPVECESRIPRPDEVPAVKSTGTGPTPRVSVNDVSIGTSAAPNSREPPVSPGALRSPKGGFASPTRGLFKSRIPPSPSPEGPRRSHSLRQSGVSTASAAPSTAGVVGAPITLAAALEAAEGGSNLEAVPNSHSSSDAGAGALAESSSQARADFLANQLKIADAFRQSLESELRDLRFKNAGLQTQVCLGRGWILAGWGCQGCVLGSAARTLGLCGLGRRSGHSCRPYLVHVMWVVAVMVVSCKMGSSVLTVQQLHGKAAGCFGCKKSACMHLPCTPHLVVNTSRAMQSMFLLLLLMMFCFVCGHVLHARVCLACLHVCLACAYVSCMHVP